MARGAQYVSTMLTHDATTNSLPEEPVSQVRLRVAPRLVEDAAPTTADFVEEKTKASAPTREDILAYLPIVESEVARFLRRLPRSVLRDDLVSAGTVGLFDALRKNGGERDVRFEHYVRIRVRGAILDELRREDWLSRGDRAKQRAAETAGGLVYLEDLAEGGMDAESSDESPADATARRMCWDAVASAVDTLPPRERELVELYYLRGWMAKDIARSLGVSEPRVSQLHAQAMTRLREKLGAWRPEPARVPAPPASTPKLAPCVRLSLVPAPPPDGDAAPARLAG